MSFSVQKVNISSANKPLQETMQKFHEESRKLGQRLGAQGIVTSGSPQMCIVAPSSPKGRGSPLDAAARQEALMTTSSMRNLLIAEDLTEGDDADIEG